MLDNGILQADSFIGDVTHLQDMAENAAEATLPDTASEGIEITDADEAEQALSATLAAFTEADEKEMGQGFIER